MGTVRTAPPDANPIKTEVTKLMFVINEENSRVPVKVWLQNKEDLDKTCLEQAMNLSRLPFVHKWVSLMPDTHAGYGMPIGGVLATKGVIIPNAVGVDIGCGMSFAATNIRLDSIADVTTGSGSLIKMIVGEIMRNIPVGFDHHAEKQPSQVMDAALAQPEAYTNQPELFDSLQDGYYQIGTLGGGNHFIEIQVDDEGCIGLMLHSGSRHFGLTVCKHFGRIARELNERWHSSVPAEWQLPFLPVDTAEGKDYITWMQLAMDFAAENRQRMMDMVKDIVLRRVYDFTRQQTEYTTEINCHHNYAAIEHHYGSDVWVHRKGATRARAGELAVIPGAMGSFSYVVEGLGNPESFCTSSHGAGRQYSRKGAMEKFSVQTVMDDLNAQGVVLGKHSKQDVAEESRFAYKDIDAVMTNQTDCVRPVKRLRTVAVIKG